MIRYSASTPACFKHVCNSPFFSLSVFGRSSFASQLWTITICLSFILSFIRSEFHKVHEVVDI
jgi:hypothetical protein